jgi:hypothetical protein
MPFKARPVPAFEYLREHVLFCVVDIGGEDLACKPQAVGELAGKDRIMCEMMGCRSQFDRLQIHLFTGAS